jgi:hypothetical protein
VQGIRPDDVRYFLFHGTCNLISTGNARPGDELFSGWSEVAADGDVILLQNPSGGAVDDGTCPKCGVAVEEDALFCVNCGTKVR